MTAIERVKNGECGCTRWLCQCDCGVQKIVGAGHLRSGNTQSCGCWLRESRYGIDRAKDLTGLVYSRLKVIKRVENDKQNTACWLCRCSCGRETVARGSMLRNGHTKSCGCWQREKARKSKGGQPLPNGEGAFNRLFDSYQRGARRRNYAWELTKEEFRDLTKQPCYYCGRQPSNVAKGHGRAKDYIYSGIDRLMNTKGYNQSNCQACCIECNDAKKARNIDEFLAWIERVYNYSIADRKKSNNG